MSYPGKGTERVIIEAAKLQADAQQAIPGRGSRGRERLAMRIMPCL